MGCKPIMPTTIDNIIKLDGDSDSDGNDVRIFGFFTIGKSDRFNRSKRNKIRFKNNYNLQLKCKGHLIFKFFARLWVNCQGINTSQIL